jgi:hypothetical protein
MSQPVAVIVGFTVGSLAAHALLYAVWRLRPGWYLWAWPEGRRRYERLRREAP